MQPYKEWTPEHDRGMSIADQAHELRLRDLEASKVRPYVEPESDNTSIRTVANDVEDLAAFAVRVSVPITKLGAVAVLLAGGFRLGVALIVGGAEAAYVWAGANFGWVVWGIAAIVTGLFAFGGSKSGGSAGSAGEGNHYHYHQYNQQGPNGQQANGTK